MPPGRKYLLIREWTARDRCSNEARRYTIFATATDACGNTSVPVATGAVTVPHDQREHPGPCRNASR